MEVAQTILKQLGGDRFILMTGAKDLIGTPDSLRFRVPATLVKERGTHVEVRLNGLDLYDLRLLKKLNGAEATTIDTRTNVYAGDLQAEFRRMTGLATSL